MLTKEQAEEIKKQIIKQIDSWKASDEKKEQAKKQILAMNEKGLEEFLIKNNLIRDAGPVDGAERKSEKKNVCPFCLIANGKIPSFIIEDGKNVVAVLEINPLSRGHILIIPKKHEKIEKIPSKAFTLAKKLARKIKSKLKAEEVSIQTTEINGHAVINVIPVYQGEELKKYRADEKELKELQEKLKTEKRRKSRKKKKKIKDLPTYPRRIP